MTLQETIELMQEIKNFYPRFEMGDMTIKAWNSRLQYIPLTTAQKLLHNYVDNDDKNRVPPLSVFISKNRDDSWHFAKVDPARNILLWMPTPELKIEKIVRWNRKKELWEDQDGYEWGFPGE